MPHRYWFKITYSFMCPSCNKMSNEMIIANSPTNDVPALKASANQQKLACLLCKAPLADGVEVTVTVHPETPESLNAQGFVYSPSNKTYMKSRGNA
jgi:hypothetical protein